MKTLTLLESNMDLGGIILMIIGIIAVVLFLFSLVIAAITKVIYEWDNTKKFSTGQFWKTVLICMLIGGLISGFVCGGM